MKTALPYRNARAGLTLIELMVALTVSGIVLLGASRFLQSTMLHYTMQEQLAILHQDTQYALGYLSDVVMQAGADMPDSGLAVVQQASIGDDSITVLTNPRGGVQIFSNFVVTAQSIPVDDASGFLRRDARPLTIVKKPYDRRLAVELYTLDESYNPSGGTFIYGADTTHDSIRLASGVGFDRSDAIYAYVTETYYLKSGVLYRGADMVVEGLDSVSMVFRDSTGASTNLWDRMQVCDLCVRGVTASKFPGYTGSSDKRCRLQMSMKVRLRNKG